MRNVIFALFVTGLFLIFNVSLLDILRNIRLGSSKLLHAKRASEEKKSFVINSKDLNKYQSFKKSVEMIIKSSRLKISIDIFIEISLLCAALGFISGIFLENILLAFVVAFTALLIPYHLLLFARYTYLKELNSSLNLGLTLITNSYLQYNDLLISCKMNMQRLEEPLKQVIKEFIVDVDIINPNVIVAIRKMQSKVENKYFHRWCDFLIQSQNDRDFKNVLVAIVGELSDAKRHQIESDTVMFTVYKDYSMMVLATLFTIPALRVMNYGWYSILMHTTVGKIIVAIAFALLALMTFAVIRINKPISIT